MDSLKSVLENDRPLVALLVNHDSISYNGDDWIQWKDNLKSVLDDYSHEELPEVINWCISNLQTSLEEYIKAPLPQFYKSNRNGISYQTDNPDFLNKQKQNIIVGYQKRIRHFELLSSKSGGSAVKGSFRLNDRKGYRIDLIRILDAMHEMEFFMDTKGVKAKKQAVMKEFGEILGIDLSNYDTDLSQALSTLNTETNIKIFSDLQKTMHNKIISKT